MTELTFQYRAIDERGAVTKGVVRAVDRTAAYHQIVGSGLKPVHLAPARGSSVRWRGSAASAKDLARITYQFSVLMEARIPIADSLRSIADQESNRRLAQVLEEVAGQIEAGNSVTDALSAHRALFGDIYIETIRAAETSGNMIQVLARLAEMLDQRYETSKNVKSALMYPACVIAALCLAVTFLMIVVVPKLSEMFASQGVELPALTQGLMAVAGFVRSYWYILLAGGVGVVFGVRKAWNTQNARQRIDGWLHWIPGLREILTGLAVSRFAHVLGLSLQSGLGLIEALELSGRSSGRPLLESDARKMSDQVKNGGRLSEVLLTCKYLPGFARRMIASGEEAAELPKMCRLVARHYDREVMHLTKNLGTIIEPIAIVGLAGVVLVVALAIFLPMWNMGTLLK